MEITERVLRVSSLKMTRKLKYKFYTLFEWWDDERGQFEVVRADMVYTDLEDARYCQNALFNKSLAFSKQLN
jgi:hypothetical protein